MFRIRIHSLIAILLIATGIAGCSTGTKSHEKRGNWWTPKPGDTWQFQYEGPLDLSVEADIFDLDYESTTKDQIRSLHRKGRKVVCYIDAGTWESFRPDADEYHKSLLGPKVDGWPNERWLNIKKLDGPKGKTGKTLRQLIVQKMKICRDKGFDGIDPDWQDAYQNRSGFRITAQQQLSFNRFLAREAHKLKLAVGLKNDKEQTKILVDDFDFGVDEECQQFDECLGAGVSGDSGWKPFIKAGKAVVNIEYVHRPKELSVRRATCIKNKGMAAIVKNVKLDAWRFECTLTK